MSLGVLAQAVVGAQVLGGLPPMPGHAECTPDAESAGQHYFFSHVHNILKGVVVLCTPLMPTTACTIREQITSEAARNEIFMSGENYNCGEMPRRAHSTAAHYTPDRK
ncbi:hypothetical protein B0H16DRAFT_1464748 [Mycena metata]|uniref:Uncharacterized protein n=1 Tax=Mycena metata TaxID=1033252 RepID=A0AAD7IF47_9AGAR|nr:hypothetical protein B0H16DRAFT_1464748 [Mycena metata]